MIKRKQMFPALIVLVIIVICAVAPAFFIPSIEPEPTPQPTFDVNYRADIYARSDAGELAKVTLESSEVDATKEQACREVMDTILSNLVADSNMGETLISSGTNLYSLTDELGRSINVMEYYREWKGDWKNWFIIQMDLDTGEIYHAYISSMCLQNFAQYTDVISIYRDYIWESWAFLNGMQFKSLEIIDQTHFEFTVSKSEEQTELQHKFDYNEVIRAGSDSDQLRYYVLLSLYEDAGPSMVVDIEFTLRGS